MENLFNKLTEIICNNHLGDYASIIGLIVSIIGFSIAIINIYKSKTALEAAKTAVDEVKDDLNRFDVVTEITNSIREMEEIKRIQRSKTLQALPDRYALVRKSLINIKSNYSHLSNEQKIKLQEFITNCTVAETKIDKSLITDKNILGLEKLNQNISTYIDELQGILIEIKKQIGGE